MDIIIDTEGQADLTEKDQLVDSDDDDDIDFGNDDTDPLSAFSIEEFKDEKKSTKKKVVPSKDFDLEEFEKDMGWAESKKLPKWKKQKKVPDINLDVEQMKQELTPVEKVLQKSAIKPGFEQLESVPPYEVSRRKLIGQRRWERQKTKGKKWFGLPAPEITEDVKHDLEVIQMRSVLDPKHFYKKNDLKALPKYFQIGKVVDSPVDYYSGRLTKKERKKTIVDELMADAEFAKYNRRKYKEIIEEKKKLHYKAHKHAKRLKGKKGKKK